MNNNTKKEIYASIVELLASIIILFISTGFIMWGWNSLAPHINCPLFTYWEIFGMRTGLSFFMTIIWPKKN